MSWPVDKNKTKQKGAKGASDTRLNRRSLVGHPVSTSSLVSRSSSISEVDFCELDETEDALLAEQEEPNAGRCFFKNIFIISAVFSQHPPFARSTYKKNCYFFSYQFDCLVLMSASRWTLKFLSLYIQFCYCCPSLNR